MRWKCVAPTVAMCALAASAPAESIRNWIAAPYWAAPARESATEDGWSVAIASRTRTPAAALVSSIPLPFIALTPCRLVDTRGNGFAGPFGPPSLAAGVPRSFMLAGSCGIPSSAAALSVNFTVTNTQGNGFLLAFPEGDPIPTVSTLNYVAGQTVANAAIVPVAASAGLTVVAGVSGADLLIDVNGYYAPLGASLGTIFNYTGNATVNSTLAISGSTNSASPNQIRSAGPLPVACTLDTFFVFMDTAPTVLTTFTLQRNANDGNGFLNTNASCSIGVGGNACQAASPSVTFAAGDLAMTNVTGAAGAGGRASVSWRCR
jgi:hypothetical protein